MQTTSAERGQNVMMLAFCNAAGGYIPPIFLFSLKKENPRRVGIYPFKDFLPDNLRFIPSIVTELPPGSTIH
jgi:hypothetical protein